jgi:hypothetical protein
MSQKDVGDRGYDLVPAAVDSFHTYATLAVKLIKNKRSLWFTRGLKDGIHSYHYPDRTVYRMCQGKSTTGISPEIMDMYLDFSILSNPELYKNLGYRYVMISPPHMGFRKSPIRTPHLKIFADSGGFQIRQGITDFVDPDVLADFYNASTDIGIGLDIPMHPLLYDKYLARMSHVASKNNKYIKSKLDPGIKLYDLNHGMDLKDRKIFFDVTEQYEPQDGIALAGTSSKARGEYGVAAHIVNGVIGISYILARSKGRYRSAHILGTTTTFYMFVFHLITKSGFFPHITSDSSTYIQASSMNTMLCGRPGQSLIYRNVLPKDNVLYRCPCTCPVCAMVVYAHHIHVDGKANQIHGLYHFEYVNQTIEAIVDDFIAGRVTVKQIMPIVAPSAFQPRHFIGVMQFLQDMFEGGFGKAYKKNLPFINDMLGKDNRGSLFKNYTKKVSAPHGDDVRTDRILKSYEDWQKKRGVV